MPSGPPELHAYWCGKDKDGFGDRAAVEYLRGQGYVLCDDWRWIAPDRDMTGEEFKALKYLMLEWDYGGVMEQE